MEHHPAVVQNCRSSKRLTYVSHVHADKEKKDDGENLGTGTKKIIAFATNKR